AAVEGGRPGDVDAVALARRIDVDDVGRAGVLGVVARDVDRADADAGRDDRPDRQVGDDNGATAGDGAAGLGGKPGDGEDVAVEIQRVVAGGVHQQAGDGRVDVEGRLVRCPRDVEADRVARS